MMRVGIDIGGTFTDGVIFDPDGHVIRHEKASSTPDDPIRGLVEVLRKLGVEAERPELFVHGTTLVTNLILQRTGGRVGLITTRGFRDVLEIQRSYRPEPLNLMWVKPEPLVPRDMRAEVGERTLASGAVLSPPNRDEVIGVASDLVGAGAEALAVCFLNSFANPANERLIQSWLKEALPDVPVSISSDVDPQIREYERVSTTTINAYAIPEMRAYLRNLRHALKREVLLMHSGGGVLPAAAVAERPVKLVQSGPAAGVIAAQRLGRRLGRENLITFDMGGTSTDVSVIVGGQLERAAETEITWGIPLRAESLEIRSIGAGGGSIAYRDEGNALKVGPRSAGAQPGPVCYGWGGEEPTVTDANLLLGLLHPERFLGGHMQVDVDAARKALAELSDHFGLGALDTAAGIHAMVNASMAQLIREMTVNKGRDPREFTLVSFGGAGGQHSYGVAELVGCSQVLFPRHAGAFSALGLVQAELQTSEAQSLLVELASTSMDVLNRVFAEMEDRSRGNFDLAGGTPVGRSRRAMIRYVGQTHEVMVDIEPDDSPDSIYERFEDTHHALFGTRLDDPAELVSLHITLAIPGSDTADPAQERTESAPVQPIEQRDLALFGEVVPVYDGDAFRGGERLKGPALIEEQDTVIVVPPGSFFTYDDRIGVYALRLEERA
jgi:N-methylhydantoinase A